MPKNIVIFGPAHAGKSTLVGYLISKLRMNDNELCDAFAEIKMQMGASYDKSERFAYLVDTHKDERLPDLKPLSGDKGHSLYMHMEQINIGEREIHIIDTPGAEHRSRDRQKGLFYGDIGIFMIEIGDLSGSLFGNSVGDITENNKWERLKQFLLPLFSSHDFTEGNKRLIIVISKMDTRDFSEETFTASKQRLFQLMNDNSLTVIPIAIDVDQGKDHNVVNKSEQFKWFEEKTLLDHLEGLVKKGDTHQPGPTLLPISRLFDKQWLGLVAEGKLINGSMKIEQRVKILPVTFQHKTFEVLEAKIGNMRIARGKDITEASPGEIIAAQLQDLRISERRCDKSELDIIDTTTVVNPNVRLAYGSVLKFYIEDMITCDLSTLETINIIWFGKKLSSKLISKAFQKEKTVICVETEGGPVVMPLDGDVGDKPLFKHFLISTQTEHMLQGHLISISEPISITFTAGSDWDVSNYFKGLEYNMAGQEVTIGCTRGAKSCLLMIRRFAHRYGGESSYTNIKYHLNTGKVYK